MNIIIIGCGYVGMALAQHLQNMGHVITATTTTQERIEELEKVANQSLYQQVNLPSIINYKEFIT